jgi:hypothetical protein
MASNISTSAIKDIYRQILRVESNTITTSEKAVADALGNEAALKISTLAVRATNKFYFGNPGIDSSSLLTFLVHDTVSKEVKVRTLSSIAQVMPQYVARPDAQALATASTKIDISSANNLPIDANNQISVNSLNQLVLASGYYKISASLRVEDTLTPTITVYAQINKVGSSTQATTVDKLISTYKLIIFSEIVFVSNADVTNSTNKFEIKMHVNSDTATITGGYVHVEKIAMVDAEIGTIGQGLTPP